MAEHMAWIQASPDPGQVVDALEAAGMGADLGRLAEVCRHVADRHEGIARHRLLTAAESLGWTAEMLAILDGPGTGDLRRCR